jgi:hypothetical protein
LRFHRAPAPNYIAPGRPVQERSFFQKSGIAIRPKASRVDFRQPAATAGLPLACVAQTERNQTSLLTDCTGNYQCTYAGGFFTGTVHREGDTCLIGLRTLAPDGSSSFDGRVGSWKGTVEEFDVCVEPDANCAHCKRIEAEPPRAPSATRCTGTPSSCSSHSAGTCSYIRGCRMATHVHYNGTYDNECEGTPERCDRINNEDSCNEQGCDWK